MSQAGPPLGQVRKTKQVNALTQWLGELMLHAVAAQFADSTGAKLGFNDMSLPRGGTFDLNSNWSPPGHCGHQVGNEVDFRNKLLSATNQRIAPFFFEKHNFVPKPELVGTAREHWHTKYYGPGTYLGPGNTLSRP
jgi:hypothetical protein